MECTEELQEIKGAFRYEVFTHPDGSISETYEGEPEDIITLLKWQGKLPKEGEEK